MSTNMNPLYIALRQLIEDQRLTGITAAARLDGVALLPAGDDTIDSVTDVTYDAQGFSTQRSPWGGQMVEAVELLRAQTTNKEAAAALPQWYVRASAISDHADPKQEYTARENATFVFMTRAMTGFAPRAIAIMNEYSPRYYKKGTTEPEYRYLPADEIDFVPGGANPGDAIPNHRIVVGDWTSSQIGEWAKHWLGRYTTGQYDPGAEVLGV